MKTNKSNMTRLEAIKACKKLYAYIVNDEEYIGLSCGEFMDPNRCIRSLLDIERCCKNCDFWNVRDYAFYKNLENYVCSCTHWTDVDIYTWYTKPNNFCSYFKSREKTKRQNMSFW